MILGKLAPPGAPTDFVARPRLGERFDRGERVVTVVAPPGYGKTEAARQWTGANRGPTAWLSVDLLDDSPDAFWRDLLDALRRVIPTMGAGSKPSPEAREPDGTAFLGSLIALVEQAGTPAAIVVDDLGRVADRSVLDGIALMVDRVGQLLRFVIISRSDPMLPTARWRSAGWLADVREEHLRLTDAEAVAVSATFPAPRPAAAAVVALNRRAEGWAAGLHLALLAAAASDDPDRAARLAAGSDRLLADYLVAEVLDALPDRERDVALALSVLDEFDADLCAGLLGSDGVPAARMLSRRRLFLNVVDDASGAMRFHPMFRELLEHELRWRDPARRLDLHRRAAALLQARGELAVAFRHQLVVDDVPTTGLMGPARPDVDRGGGPPPPAPAEPVAHRPSAPDLHRASVGRPPEPVGALTPRESSLLDLLPTHLSYAQIGEQLHLSVNTVKGNLKAVYRKLGVSSRADAVAAALDLGLTGTGGRSGP